jgi:NADH-quinone oxidoreductase subunit K
MIHLAGPLLLSAVLAGLGVFGVLARRNAVMVLVGAELLINAVALLLVAVDAATADPLLAGQVMTLFVVTVAAAEIGVALAVVLLLFRSTASSNLDDARSLGETSRKTSEPRATRELRQISQPSRLPSEVDA